MISAAIENCLQRYKPTRILIAYSGGVDSHVLLHALVRSNPSVPVLAVHVHHGLSPNADKWAEHCADVCQQYGVACQCLYVQVENQGKGIEAAARDARYQEFEKLLVSGDILLTAHHADDQIETFMLRLLRGAGLEGLSAMSESRSCGAGLLVRPLLQLQRSELMAYAEDEGFRWVDDESNDDNRYDRNFLRNQLFPLIESRWPQYRQTVTRAINHIQNAAGNEQEQLYPELNHRLTVENALKIVGFEETDRALIMKLLRLWLGLMNLTVPSQKVLEEIVSSVIFARADAEPAVYLKDYSIRRFKTAIYAVPVLAELPRTTIVIKPDVATDIPGVGTVELVSEIAKDDKRWLLSGRFLPLTVAFRVGGERAIPVGRQGSRDLKRLLQEYRIEPWWRDRLPLLYWNGELVMVADQFVCEGFQAAPGEMGYRLKWRRPRT
ncbi:tRNA lysidine(34) synthetase TilS [Gynuella sunshinyii]|nr:tRNA lysidine(34) synthetase TilS [Gynuella sunshinyii]